MGDVMIPVGPTVPADATVLDAAQLLSADGAGQVAVLDAAGRYVGVVSARALAETLADGEHDDELVRDLALTPPAVTVEDTVDDAFDLLESAHAAVPVLDADATRLVGWLTHQRVLAAFRPAPVRPCPGGRSGLRGSRRCSP